MAPASPTSSGSAPSSPIPGINETEERLRQRLAADLKEELESNPDSPERKRKRLRRSKSIHEEQHSEDDHNSGIDEAEEVDEYVDELDIEAQERKLFSEDEEDDDGEDLVENAEA
jgi:hypothetical protein